MSTPFVGRADDGKLCVRGLYVSDDISGFDKGAELSLKVNFEMLDEPLKKWSSIWIHPNSKAPGWATKAFIARAWRWPTRANWSCSAPGLKEFGEDKEIDRLIRKYGYRGTPETLARSRPTPSCKTI